MATVDAADIGVGVDTQLDLAKFSICDSNVNQGPTWAIKSDFFLRINSLIREIEEYFFAWKLADLDLCRLVAPVVHKVASPEPNQDSISPSWASMPKAQCMGILKMEQCQRERLFSASEIR